MWKFALSAQFALASGNQLPAWETSVSNARQNRYLAACDIDPARYGTAADPTILCTDCILGLRRARVRLDQLVHLEQRLCQSSPVAIDAKLAVRAHVESVEDTADGEVVRSQFEFLRENGEVAVTAETVTLVADPGHLRTMTSTDAAAGAADLRILRRKLLIPTKVQAYTEETGNRIHFDPSYAVRHGLRAPVAPGLMAVTWSVEALATNGMPDTFDLTARFFSPLFWDDGVDVLGGRGAAGRMDESHFRSSAGAEVAAVTIHPTP